MSGSRKLRLLLTAVALAAAASLVTPTANAANLAPNPGFENDCGGLPCNWTATFGTASRDTLLAHSGSASAKLVSQSAGGGFSFGNFQSVCIQVTPGATYPASFWYYADSSVTQVEFTLIQFTDTNCTTGVSNATRFGASAPNTFPGTYATPLVQGAWTQLAANLTVEATTHSLKLNLATDFGTTNFDDVLFGTDATAVTLRALGAQSTPRGVRLRWRTASEIGLLGFNVYRQLNGQRVRANSRLIRADGAGAYSFLDRKAPRARAARYWIQTVNLDGSRAWYGPARVQAAR